MREGHGRHEASKVAKSKLKAQMEGLTIGRKNIFSTQHIGQERQREQFPDKLGRVPAIR